MNGVLDPLTLPLNGSHLIEASAGTGKTWTIAALVLRLVLGLGGPVARPLMPREILILTFTRAATKELVDRIRQRLVQAQAGFEAQLAPDEIDPFLQSLIDHFPEGPSRQEAAWRLARAAAGMDDAAVLTIDAWVQRLLAEHLTPVGQTGPEELLESDAHWLLQAVQDYWREQVYPLDADVMRAVHDVTPSPEALQAWLAPALSARCPAPPVPAQSLLALLAQRAAGRRATLEALQQGWVRRAQAIRQWFAARLEENPNTFSGTLLRGGMDMVHRWCEALEAWATGHSAWLPGVNAGKASDRRLRERLTPTGLMALHKQAFRPADEAHLPAWSREFENLVQQLDQLDQVHETLGVHALGWVANRLALVKQQRRAWTFDDLLDQAITRLAAQPDRARTLRAQYPVALIDEFQDTSPRQLALLTHIYPLGGLQETEEQETPGTPGIEEADVAEQSGALLLIGDPKQSIYRFRGADIHAYLQTRRALYGRLHALDCNRRSVPELVAAVNHLFAQAERRTAGSEEGGAFLHGSDVPFEPVRSAGPQERLVRAGVVLPALCVWTEPQARGPAEGRAIDAARAAEQMVALLNDPQVGFADGRGGFRRLRARDCCVLVRTRTEAQAIRRALWARGVPSAYLSERDSVLQSDEAMDVLMLLQALHEPQDPARARAVWASPSVGLTLEQQLAERGDEALWDARLQTLRACAERWASQGVLAAVRDFIRLSGLSARCLQDRSHGARRLTNWLHLAEWLQSASESYRTPAALLEAYSRLLAEPDRALHTTAGLRDATLLRLESDLDVVQVVTIHKSKGLQYPLVWLPFAVSNREESVRTPAQALVWDGQRWGVAGDVPDPEEAASARDSSSLEVLREDVRLLYVALTRAVHQVWLGACPRKPREDRSPNWHQTALGHLVSGRGNPRADAEVVSDLLDLWPASEGSAGTVVIEVLDPQASPPITPLAHGEDPTSGGAGQHATENPVSATDRPMTVKGASLPRPARRISHRVDTRWRLSSYTALARDAGDAEPGWRTLPWDEAIDPATVTPTAPLPTETPDHPIGTWHAWASSAAFGQFLHELLEEGAEWGFRLSADSPWGTTIRARIDASAWRADGPALLQWIHRVVSEPILPDGGALAGLRTTQAELEFWMPLARLDTGALDTVLQRHIWPGASRPALKPRHVEGLLMGFSDLVFQSASGRFEVLDYKSNRLGGHPRDYHPQALQTAVLAHRYDLQAALYLLALYRLLRYRCGAQFNPARQLGSAHFLFLRGIDQPHGALISIPAQREWLEALDALLGGSPHPNQDALQPPSQPLEVG